MAKKQNLREAEKVALRLISSAKTCYNPECDEPLLTTRGGVSIVNHDIAHIRDEQEPTDPSGDLGWRYYPDDLSQEERNTFANFIMLCRPCHKLIDKLKPRDFSVDLLHQWKSDAEAGQVVEESTSMSPDQLLEKLEELLAEKSSQKDQFDASMVTSATAAHNPIQTPDTFPNLEFEISPDQSVERREAWPPFTSASCALITFDVTNYTEFPIHEIRLNVAWQDRTYVLHNLLKISPNYERTSKFFYQFKSGESFRIEDMDEKSEWMMRRYESEILSVPQIAPNTKHSMKLQRITNRYFHKKPLLTLTFKDNDGNKWKRVNNDPPTIISAKVT